MFLFLIQSLCKHVWQTRHHRSHNLRQDQAEEDGDSGEEHIANQRKYVLRYKCTGCIAFQWCCLQPLETIMNRICSSSCSHRTGEVGVIMKTSPPKRCTFHQLCNFQPFPPYFTSCITHWHENGCTSRQPPTCPDASLYSKEVQLRVGVGSWSSVAVVCISLTSGRVAKQLTWSSQEFVALL